jgi:hypothetical protein
VHRYEKPIADLTAADRRELVREQAALDRRAAWARGRREVAARKVERAVVSLQGAYDSIRKSYDSNRSRGDGLYRDLEDLGRALGAAETTLANLRYADSRRVVRHDIDQIASAS